MLENGEESKLSVLGQVEKLGVKSIIGFETINVLGIGIKLGIFEYLYRKGRTTSKNMDSTYVSFTLKELSENLSLSPIYLDAWIHMSLACDIFEVENSHDKSFKTAPYIYDLFIDYNNKFFIGHSIIMNYEYNPSPDVMCDIFKTGDFINLDTLGSEVISKSQCATTWFSPYIEGLFSKRFKEHKKILKNQGYFLAVGCGYGYNLEYWAKKYKNAKIVGIDIDPHAVASAKKNFEQEQWNNRIEILEITVSDFALTNKNKFDVILLNFVLHEMNRDEKYRIKVFEDLYSILKEDGLLIVTTHIIPEIFSVEHKSNLVEIWHQWLEVPYGTRFYDEKSFKKFISLTSFKNAELIKKESKESGNLLESFLRGYFWALRK